MTCDDMGNRKDKGDKDCIHFLDFLAAKVSPSEGKC